MAISVRTAAVIGAGVMGSGIAAHLAGVGLRTLLLDIVPSDLSERERGSHAGRSRVAAEGLKRALEAKPAAFYDTDAARLIAVGNLEDDLAALGGCDLVIEAVTENLGIKRAVFERIAPHLKDTVILASNTSGLSVEKMASFLPEKLRPRFLVMHFFNPVRYMRLLELVPTQLTDPLVVQEAARVSEFLGKGVVYAKDTTNFVANRIGVYALMFTIHHMLESGLSIEQVDAIVGKPMGRPKSAAFQTCDLVGLDTMIHVANNCYESLTHDDERAVFQMPPFVLDMVKAGRVGRKAGAGFYKKQGPEILVLDLQSFEYRAQQKVRFDSIGAVRNLERVAERLENLVYADDQAAQFAWRVLARTLCYTARCVGEIADDIVNVDRALRWGFNWELGPFEAWDAIGVERSVKRMQAEGMSVPAWVTQMLADGRSAFYQGGALQPSYYDPAKQRAMTLSTRELGLDRLKAQPAHVLQSNPGASLIDLGDGVLCVEAHTKMNTLDPDVISMLGAAVDEAEKNFQAIVIGNEGEHFGAGANLMLIAMAAMQKQWDTVEGIITALQNALQRLRYARVPVVAAPFQYTLGGGCEVALAADACQAFAETYMGLVEVGVGLIPAGGGCLRMVERFTEGLRGLQQTDPLPAVGQAWLQIATAKASTSAEEARALRYLRPGDGISLNKDDLLLHAKQRALGLARSGYRPPRPLQLATAGLDAAKTLEARTWGMVEGGWASEHDALIANKLAYVLCGGVTAEGTLVDEQHYLDLEREAFLSLCGEAKTHARIQQMLQTGKPLRN